MRIHLENLNFQVVANCPKMRPEKSYKTSKGTAVLKEEYEHFMIFLKSGWFACAKLWTHLLSIVTLHLTDEITAIQRRAKTARKWRIWNEKGSSSEEGINLFFRAVVMRPVHNADLGSGAVWYAVSISLLGSFKRFPFWCGSCWYKWWKHQKLTQAECNHTATWGTCIFRLSKIDKWKKAERIHCTRITRGIQLWNFCGACFCVARSLALMRHAWRCNFTCLLSLLSEFMPAA